MKKTFVTMVASLAMAAMLPATAANATIYNFTFTSFDGMLTATGQMTVDAFNDVTAVSGTIAGLANESINAVVANPSFPSTVTSPDGSFTYNDLFYSSDPYFDNDGLLFTTVENVSGFWNLWGNGPGNYSLFESMGSGNYTVQEAGNLTVATVPELSTWAMMFAGFAGLGLAGRRRTPRAVAINCA